MKLKWYPGAQEALQNTARYIQIHFGNKSCKEFLREVVRTEKLLRQHPNIGPIEPLLADLPKTYRSIVINSLNKLVYRIEEDVIIVVDFWDVRRDPNILANQVK